MKRIFFTAFLLGVLTSACGVKTAPLPPLTPEQAAIQKEAEEKKAAKDAAQRKAIEEEEKASGENEDD